MPEKALNALLRAWRNANRLTRVEMADQINATPTGIADPLACDQERVRRWETGDVRWPSTPYRLALTQLTGLTPEELGFSRPVRDEIVKTPPGTAVPVLTNAPQGDPAPDHMGGVTSQVEEAELRLATDRHITAALDWLDQQAGWEPGGSRLSEPMAWLAEHPDHWRTECTGFGFNLVSGNFEFASLIVIDNEEWWTRFGGHTTANWESSGMRRYSTLDTDLIASLLRDPAWSNEGLFALSEGLRRLSEIGGSRVNLPTIEVEL
ncbi:helix-turn-helix domain-containing protein [Streptosporangium sp. NBC_01755]|uniref:helix-turn-helix domain-containing protein n=1 Tax=Streptosporangium sp. NBC_01755 TaxID=2975949 RepID=UPI002DDBE538|nr:helix-turn-helix transcriptional regulator [Streptosporangium sp. NBC_01755]WSC97334.1 helix-turn-helix domain-containing protein [Streptosporangium sp. NBC_01755]